jgi:hypothetical protein
MIMMYGGAPEWVPEPEPPKRFEPLVPLVSPATFSAMTPCPTCKRHIHVGSMCPFCFAEQVAKAPSRASLEAVKKSLEEALKVVNEALAK